MRRNFFVLLLAWVAAGCVAPTSTINPPRPLTALAHDEFVAQRAVLTVRGRQFALNGYFAQSITGGQRLVITEMFGHVIADVLVKPDGAVHVMRSSRLFRPAWIARYVVADMRCILGAPEAGCPVQKLSATHFVIKRRWYELDLQTVESKPGPQPARLFDEKQEAK